jgi:hypothetical protein
MDLIRRTWKRWGLWLVLYYIIVLPIIIILILSYL